MKLLFLDIETSPNLAWTFDMRNAFISIDQLVEPSRMICFSAKWLGNPEVMFLSEFHDGQDCMISRLHTLLDQADAVCHYNGRRFDIPKINGEFYKAGFAPPSPYQQIDLYQTIKRFSFPSGKLAYALKVSNLPGKLDTGGFRLWAECMNGNEKAWAAMKKYSIQDTAALEPLYLKLLPWIPNHPNLSIGSEELVCTRCGSEKVQKRGTRESGNSRYQRYQCQECFGWSTAIKREDGSDIRGLSA